MGWKGEIPMQIEERIARLIAVGASVAANCEPCLAANVKQALEAGASAVQVSEAIAVGRLVRQGAASAMDALISDLEASDLPAGSVDLACDCVQHGRMP
jgi:AhpD family alkylhydroperoxidase